MISFSLFLCENLFDTVCSAAMHGKEAQERADLGSTLADPLAKAFAWVSSGSSKLV